LREVESLNAHIKEYDRRIEKMARETYPEVELLKQVEGVGDLIALTYVLTIDDQRRFRKSREAGCFVGLQPGRRNSGQSEHRCTSARRATAICGRFWCKGRTTSWDLLGKTVICGAGD
jgi:transposase